MEVINRNRDISLILLLFVAVGIAYSIVNPLHEATDELRHYRFARYIVENGRLPVQGAEACRFQSHHPPLFYVLGAAATSWIEVERDLCYTPPENPFWAYRSAEVGVDNKNQYLHGPDETFPWKGEALAAHILRAVNVLLGMGTVWLTWAVGRAIWPRQRGLAAGGAALVAFNPMFLYMAGAVNNDVIAAFSGAAVLLGTVRLLGDAHGLSRRWGLLLGLLFGLALMSKFNMVAVAILIAVAVTYVAWKEGQWTLWLQVGLIAVGVTLLVAGWWFVRNQMLYGEPTGLRTLTELWGVRDPAESVPLAIQELPAAWSSLWGRFGFGQIPLPEPVYDTLAWAVLAGLLGTAASLFQSRNRKLLVYLLLLSLDVVLAFAILFNYMLVSPAGAMGRFFFPGLPALALLTFFGISQIGKGLVGVVRARGVPQVFRKNGDRLADAGAVLQTPDVLAFITGAATLALSLVALFGYLAPAYARPPTYSADSVPNEVNASFAGLATLRGYLLHDEVLRPGDPLDVDFYWEVTAQPPGNFLLFLHVMDGAGTMVAQRDTHPGTGNFPTRQWRAGDRFVDSLRVYIPETAYTPSQLTVSAGLYAPEYRLAISGPQGQAWGDALTLGTVQLQPAWQLVPEGVPLPNPMSQNFEDKVSLRGYEYGERILSAGSELSVTLYWERLAQPQDEYRLRLEVMDEAGNVRGDWEEALPVAAWPRGAFSPTNHSLPLALDLSPGTYGLRLILLDPINGNRHHLVASDGHFIAEHLDLARIRVTAAQEARSK